MLHDSDKWEVFAMFFHDLKGVCVTGYQNMHLISVD